MRRLIAFENTTLDGYFTGPNGDMSWAYEKVSDPEFDAMAIRVKEGRFRVKLADDSPRPAARRPR